MDESLVAYLVLWEKHLVLEAIKYIKHNITTTHQRVMCVTSCLLEYGTVQLQLHTHVTLHA